MTTLIVGASGATGRLLTRQLLDRGQKVKAVVRSPASLPAAVRSHENLTVITASILDLSDAEMADHLRDCDAIASCLGHTLSFKGVFAPPYRLVTNTVRRLCDAARANDPGRRVKYVLMNSSGVRNRDLDEPISFAQKCVIALLRALLPPHADNEAAADYLRTRIGQSDPVIEWAAVRPDTLVDEGAPSERETHPSPTRSAIFDAGETSRINVGGFMADLITDEGVWDKWKGRMPVIYNKAP